MAPETNFRHPQAMPNWLELDDILMGNAFAHLQKVDLEVHFFFVGTASYLPQININTTDTSHILPRLSTHPSIVSQLHIGNI